MPVKDAKSPKLKGRIISVKKGVYAVRDELSSGGQVSCASCTRLRIEGKKPFCGDYVIYEDNGDGSGFITDLLPRKNSFPRPSVANADILAIVVAAASPDPDLYYIDKLTCLGAAAGVEVAVIVNKNDLKDGRGISGVYEKCGFKTFLISAARSGEKPLDIQNIKDYFKSKTVVLAGPSGAGKSTLLNAMYPRFKIKVGQLSKRILRGKNTTRHAELYPTDDLGYIADTPGFSALDLERGGIITFDKLGECFPEMLPFMDLCRFSKCRHTVEEGCGVLAGVREGAIPKSRHESYKKLFDALKNISPY